MNDIKRFLKMGERIARQILSGSENEAEDGMEDSSYKNVLNRLSVKGRISENAELFSRVNVEKGLKRFELRLKAQRQRRVWIGVGAVAAMVVLILSFTFLFREEVKVPGELAVSEVNVPKSSRYPELILPDGQKVILEKKTIQITGESGVLAHQDSLNQLIYASHEVQDSARSEIHTLQIPVGADYYLELSDGSKVWLNSATELRYPVQFVGKERRVCVEGEAFFEIKKDLKHPFIVEVNGVEVKVYGTRFNVNSRAKDVVRTALVEGAVSMKGDHMKEVFLKPGQMGEYDRKTKSYEVKDVDLDEYVGWKKGEYFFVDQRLEHILSELALWYDFECIYLNNTSKDIRFNCCLPKYKEIGDLLSVLASTSRVSFEIKGRTIVVK